MDTHLLIIIGIMIAGGSFGGYLNYLHNFDTLEKDNKDKHAKIKYILLVSKNASQLYTKYSILVSFDTLSRNNYIPSTRISEISDIVRGFRKNADAPLLRKIEDTLTILNFIG